MSYSGEKDYIEDYFKSVIHKLIEQLQGPHSVSYGKGGATKHCTHPPSLMDSCSDDSVLQVTNIFCLLHFVLNMMTFNFRSNTKLVLIYKVLRAEVFN